jgi:receptor protein-tyrosine kinase
MPALHSNDIELAPTKSAENIPHGGSTAHPTETAKVVRIKFNELRRRGMITPDNLRSNIAFEFRGIKRKLLANSRTQLNNTAITNNLIMVTSALPGEGKTFTAANLALALSAERDLHVLLIDADVIHPSLGTLFDSSEGPGLTDVLNGKCSSVAEAIRRCSDQPNLSVIFAGARDERAPELISSKKAADIFIDISRRYKDRIVIFDTPPVLASSETASLATYMHQAFVVVAAGAANREQVQTALDNISACQNISLIFNKAPRWRKLASDYYYYANELPANSVTP